MQLTAEEGRTEEVKVAMLTEDIRSLSFKTGSLKRIYRDKLVSVIREGSGGQLLVQQEHQPGMHILEQIGFGTANETETSERPSEP